MKAYILNVLICPIDKICDSASASYNEFVGMEHLRV